MKLIRRSLRSNMTPWERKLWSRIRSKQLGVVFRRQHSIGNYVVDFYCPSIKLAIELDGSQHNGTKAKNYDRYRTKTIENHQIKVIRFWNFEIDKDIDLVLKIVWEQVQTSPSNS